MPNVRSHPKADEEFEQAAVYIELRRPSYGTLFANEIRAAAKEIAKDPLRWPVRMYGHRKYVTQTFRYLIWYKETDDGIFITAIHHGSREPGYWKKRILDEQR